MGDRRRKNNRPGLQTLTAGRPSFVTLTVEDKNGLLVPGANNPVRFTIKGQGEIVATANGDSTSHLSFRSTERDTFNGHCLVIIRAKPDERGKIILQAQSRGLTSASLTLRSASRW